MSAVQPTTDRRSQDISSSTSLSPQKSQRVLACVLCQQRKVKCDRKFPCTSCIKSRAQCTPAAPIPRRRKRRFPERELLERLRKYEDLLRQNNIEFEPLHGESTGVKEAHNVDSNRSEVEQTKARGTNVPSPPTTASYERVYEPMNFWHALNQEFRDPEYDSDSSDDDVREITFQKAWDQVFDSNDHLLFGSRMTATDVSTLHPEPVQIFRLWQLYLENVNPLLKVTHVTTLQGLIIEAASNVLNINPNLEALIFSIYCTGVLSLDPDDCKSMLGSSKLELLARYQFGCRQALQNCGFLRTGDRDCLTALYLYLISVRPSVVPQSLSSMLGVAIRIAQRMGIHSETSLAKCPPLEAEMRRRLWWSLVLFDSRISEIADLKSTTLIPTWDCKVPLNVNDSDFRADMKETPQVQGNSSETLFAVVRSEIGDYIRHSTFHLGFTNPALKHLSKDGFNSEGSEMRDLEKTIEDKYLKFCDPQHPLHFITINTARSYLAKCRIMEHYFKYSSSSAHQSEAQHDATILDALIMLECDTQLLTSPLSKGFRWLVYSYFPFPAYIRIAQILKRRPVCDQAEQAWKALGDNYDARFGLSQMQRTPFFNIFAGFILQAWEARESAFKGTGGPLAVPNIVISVRHKLANMAPHLSNLDAERSIDTPGTSVDDSNMSIPMGFGDPSSLYRMGWQDGGITGSGSYLDMSGFDPLDTDINQLNWSAMDWNLANAPAGAMDDSANPPHPY